MVENAKRRGGVQRGVELERTAVRSQELKAHERNLVVAHFHLELFLRAGEQGSTMEHKEWLTESVQVAVAVRAA